MSILADGALLVDAQDVDMSAGAIGDEGRARLLRRHREAGVVLGHIDVPDEPVGGLDGGDPGQCELLGQAVLKRAEGALRAASGE